MALSQGHRPHRLLGESAHPEHESPGGALRDSSEAEPATSARAQHSDDPALLIPPPRRRPRGTLVARRATLTTFCLDEDGQALEIKHHAAWRAALITLFHVHRLEPPAALLRPLNPRNLVEALEEARPRHARVLRVFNGKLKTLHLSEHPDSSIPFPVCFLLKSKSLHLIKDVNRCEKCPDCGQYFKSLHTCSTRRRNFYFHHINTQSSSWWETISFFPIGACAEIRRLFVTYDIETYTWHGSFGKQLVPYLLVFKLTGAEELVQLAAGLAQQLAWDVWSASPHTYFCLSPLKEAVGKKFKAFRDALQRAATERLWAETLRQNPQVRQYCEAKGLPAHELTFPELLHLKLQGTPCFQEIYVVGHNINGFDEIVLAAQVITNKTEIPAAFKISRNFMPRNGRILFNDITFALPNPLYQKRSKDFQDWEQGICRAEDLKFQFVKFLVRDTFALTHTSLRNAAAAYALPVEKGCCPYQAVNEFYRLGTYQKDAEGFPAPVYWKDQQEYLLNKELWLQKKEKHAYDIVQQSLDYCAQDVVVTAALVEKLQHSYRQFIAESANLPEANFNIFQRPTISSNSHAIFRQILYRAERPQRPNLGSILEAPSNELYDYVRASIRGGRCYPTYIGLLEEPIYVYDICGMYASALTHPMPVGRPLNPADRALAVRAYQKKLGVPRERISYFDPELLPAIFTIDADPPREEMLDVLPPFCSRKGGRLCWTNEPLRGEVATSLDIITLHNRGWRVTLVPDERTTVFPEWKCVAREYVQLNIAAKEKADREKNQTVRSIAKLLSNALYGSFATKLDNKTTVFAEQMEDKFTQGIARGEYSVKASSYIETENLSAEVLPQFVAAYSPEETTARPVAVNSDASESEGEDRPPFIPPPAPEEETVTSYTYKPITFLDSTEGDMCLHTLEKNSPHIHNNKYPSQIASFVLAWTRAFVSEWAEFLYLEDRGIPLELRSLKSVYGDTDSLFVTEEGRRLMETKGKSRIKKNGGKLVFDPEHPDLTWLVECETQCGRCGADAYSPASIFLAPKLYALQAVVCPACGHKGPGKLRAKGHATSELSFETMLSCLLSSQQQGSEKFHTSRMSLRRTLASTQAHVQPFTVVETTLTRTLRPWKDMTLVPLADNHRLIPYSTSQPNPRNQEICWIQLP
nr:DNA polymerase protein [Lemur mastadenovirus]